MMFSIIFHWLQDGYLCMYNIWADCFSPLHPAVLFRICLNGKSKAELSIWVSLYYVFSLFALQSASQGIMFFEIGE